MEKPFLTKDKDIKITGATLLTIQDGNDCLGFLKMYNLTGSKYLWAVDVTDVAVLLKISLKSLRTSLYGSRWDKYFPRKYKKKHNDYLWFENGINVIENLEFMNPFGLSKFRALIPLESFLDIITVYSLSFMSRTTSVKNTHIGARCYKLAYTFCFVNLIEILRGLSGAAKHAVRTQSFYSLRNDKPFESCNDLLDKALLKVYPDREEWKYKALRWTIFSYAYEDVIGLEAFSKLKKVRHPFDTLCSSIGSIRIQKRLAAYIAAYSVVLELFHEMNLFGAITDKNRRTKQVRTFVQKFFKEERS